MEIRCRGCGTPIQEGRCLCPQCTSWGAGPDAILKDGTPLYIKTPVRLNLVQLDLYALLMRKEKK